jgi:hypothetical protein
VRGAEERFGAGPPAGATHTQITVLSICFRGPANAPKLDRIETVSG